jgi:hypothetical protein
MLDEIYEKPVHVVFINTVHKKCEKCGEPIEGSSRKKKFCFDCVQKRKAKWYKKNKKQIAKRAHQRDFGAVRGTGVK